MSGWDRFEPDPDPSAEGPVIAGDVAELLPADPIPEPTVWDGGHINPKVGKIDGTPVCRGKARRKVEHRPDSDPRVKLDAAARQEIRRLARQGWGWRRLAKRFGVAQTAIRRVLQGRKGTSDPIPPQAPSPAIGTRDPLPGPPTPPVRKRQAARPKLSSEARDEIRALARQGWGLRRLAKRFGVSTTAVKRLLLGISYFDDSNAPPRPCPKPKPHRWREPRGADLRRRGDDQGDDLVMLPAPPAAVAEPPRVDHQVTRVNEDWGWTPDD